MSVGIVLAALSCPEQVNGFDFSCFRSILLSDVWFGPALLVLVLTLVSQTAAVILALPLALGRISRNPWVRAPVNFYLFFFRGTPLLLQILFVYDGTAELTNNSPLLYPINRNAVIAGKVVAGASAGRSLCPSR